MVNEVVAVSDKSVSCEGGQGALGHPLVYLEIGSEGEIVCPYCSKRFVYKAKKKA